MPCPHSGASAEDGSQPVKSWRPKRQACQPGVKKAERDQPMQNTFGYAEAIESYVTHGVVVRNEDSEGGFPERRQATARFQAISKALSRATRPRECGDLSAI